MSSKAYELFTHNMGDISKLCEIDEKILLQHSILKQSILLTTISAWETYIEDVIQEKAFNSAKHTKGSLVYRVFTTSLTRAIKSTNTPNAKVIKRLTEEFLGTDITQDWAFNNYNTPDDVSEQLQKWINKRGDAAHRVKQHDEPSIIKRKELQKLISFFNGLACKTDSIIEKL